MVMTRGRIARFSALDPNEPCGLCTPEYTCIFRAEKPWSRRPGRLWWEAATASENPRQPVGRPRVNRTAAALQKAGVIRYVRGRIMVLDRVCPEPASYECYRFIRSEYDRLLD
jgi:hypothetical protein